MVLRNRAGRILYRIFSCARAKWWVKEIEHGYIKKDDLKIMLEKKKISYEQFIEMLNEQHPKRHREYTHKDKIFVAKHFRHGRYNSIGKTNT